MMGAYLSWLSVISVILAVLWIRPSHAQRYDPLFTGGLDCGEGVASIFGDTCGQGGFLQFKEPNSTYSAEPFRKWAIIGWIDNAIQTFTAQNGLERCLNDSLVTGLVKICQNPMQGKPWGFLGCAHIPCYGGNETVHLVGCLPEVGVDVSQPGFGTFGVRALDETSAQDVLDCR